MAPINRLFTLFENKERHSDEWCPYANQSQSARMTTASILSALGVLAGIVGLVLIAGRVVSRLPLTAKFGAGRILVLRESIVLDPRRRVHLLQCGQRQVVLLTGGSQDIIIGWMNDT